MDWRILDKESDSLLSIVVGRRDVEGGAPVVKVAHDAASIAQVGSRPDGRLMVGGEGRLLVGEDLDRPIQVHEVVLLARLEIQGVYGRLKLACYVVIEIEVSGLDRGGWDVQSAVDFLQACDLGRAELGSSLLALRLSQQPLLVQRVDSDWLIIDHHIDVAIDG